MNQCQILDADQWLNRMKTARADLADQLYAMYSGITGGITTNPMLMCIPVDDHLTHRGDGAFESLKCLNGSLYNVNAHLLRLNNSCASIGIAMPCPQDELERIICDTVRAGEKRDALIRILVSRGTGNMGIDPAQCNGPELYVTAYRYSARSKSGTPEPARAALSSVPIKPAELATVKTCNYLPNVLMKLEANQRGLDFVISLDENGHLGEGATENIGILTEDNELLMPSPNRVLAGTTAQRALDLAQQLIREGILNKAEYHDILPEQAAKAKEMFIFGTTTDVTPIIEWEDNPVGDGQPGPVAEKLLQLLQSDMTPKSDTLTDVFN